MTHGTVYLFANFPPPHTGATIGTEVTANLLRSDWNIEIHDISGGNLIASREGSAKVTRGLTILLKFSKLITEVVFSEEKRPTVLYLLASSDNLGHILDSLLVLLGATIFDAVTVHVRTGDFASSNFPSIVKKISKRVFSPSVDKVIFLDRGLAQKASSIIPTSKVAVIPNTIDKEVLLSRRELEMKRNRTGGSLRCLFLSNFARGKGHWTLLRASKILADQSVNVSVRFVGAWPSTDERRRFIDAIEEWDLRSTVSLLEPITERSGIRKILAWSECFVLPTSYQSEAQPRSVIEALAAGTPVVVTGHASLGRFIVHEKNGFVVQPSCPKETAEAIRRFEQENVWETMSREARRCYENMFSRTMVRKALNQTFLSATSAGAR